MPGASTILGISGILIGVMNVFVGALKLGSIPTIEIYAGADLTIAAPGWDGGKNRGDEGHWRGLQHKQRIKDYGAERLFFVLKCRA